MFVESYEFGKIVIGGKEYRSDVVVGERVVVENWWRKEGHRVCVDDLEWLKDLVAEVIIFGTGAYGRVRVDEDVMDLLKEKGFEVFVLPSKEAVEKFNELKKEGRKAVLAVHLTC